MDMVKRVLNKNPGEELDLEGIISGVKEEFGVAPAKSLDQMLYKQAHAGKNFYRTTDAKFGLLEWRDENAATG